MKIATPLTIALLALAACGDDNATTADTATQDDRTVATATGDESATPSPSAKSGDIATVTPKAPTPMPEPEEPIIAFTGQDGTLALGRDDLVMISPVHDAESDKWSVFVQLDEEAAADFYTLTTETTGEPLAVVVDEMTVSTPVLETAVYGGGFVFGVDDSEVASAVVATLKGEKPQPVQVTAGDALPTGAADDDDVAQAD